MTYPRNNHSDDSERRHDSRPDISRRDPAKFNAKKFDKASADDDRWVDYIACADGSVSEFFVEAGRVISEETLERCRRCPVRPECLVHSYNRDATGGYFAGMSPGLRKKMSVDEALEYVAQDPPQQLGLN